MAEAAPRGCIFARDAFAAEIGKVVLLTADPDGVRRPVGYARVTEAHVMADGRSARLVYEVTSI